RLSGRHRLRTRDCVGHGPALSSSSSVILYPDRPSRAAHLPQHATNSGPDLVSGRVAEACQGRVRTAADGGRMSNSAIAASGLRKAYGDKTVLDGIDLDVRAGTVFALLGPNG